MCIEACCSEIDWASWLAAIGTLLAVMAALFLDRLAQHRIHRDRAKLDLELRFEPPDCHLSGREYYFRLWITNPGRSRARSVQVFLSELARWDGTRFERDRTVLPQYLVWSHTPHPTREKTFAGISPQTGRHCELAVIAARDSRLGIPTELLMLWVQVRTQAYALRAGRYRVHLVLAAANVLPVTKVLEISYAGKWYDDEAKMLEEGVTISEA